MARMVFCLIGAAVCFGMLFGFGPTPDNQLVAICGLVCLFSAYVCWDTSRPLIRKRPNISKLKLTNRLATAYPTNPFPLAFACVALFGGLWVFTAVLVMGK